ncbi:MAG: phosphopantothenoylcysteine decarboxylase [Candidatus Gracilibacteria bacterium]|jgi:phosphopantothenoylcysteine decarboxylase/phosphopantothenate--cysteine ligase
MRKPLNFVISSGGTAVPVDDVRILTNRSKGTTGAAIAEVALLRGHKVDYVHAENARLPFGRELMADPEVDIETELQRIRSAIENYRAISDRLTLSPVTDFDHYQRSLLERVARPDMDIAILAMAASDYGPQKVDGKIASDGNGLDLHLVALAKIISQVKTTREGIFLVGFKLLTEESSVVQLLAKATRSMERDRQDLAVANIVGVNFKPKQTFLLQPGQEVIEVSERRDLPDILLDQIERRVMQDA